MSKINKPHYLTPPIAAILMVVVNVFAIIMTFPLFIFFAPFAAAAVSLLFVYISIKSAQKYFGSSEAKLAVLPALIIAGLLVLLVVHTYDTSSPDASAEALGEFLTYLLYAMTFSGTYILSLFSILIYRQTKSLFWPIIFAIFTAAFLFILIVGS